MKTLTFWALADNGFDTVPSLHALLRDFCRVQRDVEVQIQIKTYTSLWEALFLALKNPRDYPRPDLVQIPCTWAPTLGHMSLLEDLRPFVQDLTLDAWMPVLRPYCGLPDASEILSLPWWMGVRVLYYRRDVFAAAGMDPVQQLATWDGFEEACGRIQQDWARGEFNHVVANPNPKESVSLIDLAPHLWVFGGELFSRDGRRTLFHREEAFQGTAAYLRMMAEGWMPLLGRTGLVRKDLFEGFAAMQFSSRFPREALLSRRGLGAKIGAVTFPSGRRPSQTLIATRQLAAVRGSKFPREAAQCVAYLTRKDVAAAYARQVGGLPGHEELFADWFRGRDDLREVFHRALLSARALAPVSAMGVAEQVLDKSMETVVETVLRGGYKPEFLREQLLHAAAEVDYILSLYE